jgi:glycosyltransferase involved in cell wall biosynthesis
VRVLLPVHHFPPRYSAGAELYTLRLARWLLAHGHEAEVVCVERVDYQRPSAFEVALEPFEEVPVWRLSLGMAGTPSRWRFDHPLINAWVAEHIAQTQPDLIHLHGGYLLGAGVLAEAWRAGIPSVVTLHDFWFLCPRITLLRGDGQLCQNIPDDPAGCAWCQMLTNRRFGLSEQLSGGRAGKLAIRLFLDTGRQQIAERRAFLHQQLSRADAVIAPSRFLARLFAGDVAPERLFVRRIGIDTASLTALGPPREQGPLRLGYIGQIAEHKGVHVLAEAVRRLPPTGRPVELTIYGDLQQHAAYVPQLRRAIGKHPHIHLAGRFDNTRIGAVLSQFDALVVPSIWYENSPLAIMEAQAAGLPVLTSALGGMAELVRDEVDGLHFKPGDAADLARQIQRLRSDLDLLPRLRRGVQPPATIEEEMGQLMAIYRQIQRSPEIVGEVA